MSDARRVVLIGPAPPFRGGIAQHTARLADQFAEDGEAVAVETWRRQYPRLLYRRPEHEEGVSPMEGARFDLGWLNPLSWLRVASRHHRADHLVMQWVTPFHVLALGVIRLAMRPTTTTIIVHNAIPHERFPLLGPLTKLGFLGVDQVVCHADAVVADLATLGVHVEPTTVVTMPALVPIRPTPLPAAPPYRLLFLGYVRPYKGADIAIDAMAEIREKDPGLAVTLTIAGECWSDDMSLVDHATDRGVDDVVTVMDRYISDEEMVECIDSHHLLVAPYRSATQSGVIALARAGGRPTVATDVGGLAELVDDGATGILCPPNDATAFADAVQQAIKQLDHLASGAAAKQGGWTSVAEAIMFRSRITRTDEESSNP